MDRAKLAVFSPLPPCENGIADYTFELLPLHAQDFDVTVVLDDRHPAPLQLGDANPVRTVFLTEYLADRTAYADHIHLYHLGNNPDHVYMLPMAMERPGIVVLHDVSLHYLIDCATLRWGGFSDYTAFLWREYGALGRLLGEQFEQYRWRERAMFYELPMTRTLLERAKGVVVHSAFAYFKVKAQCPDAPVTLIPHHLSPAAGAVDGLDRRSLRRKLGLDDVELVLLSLGFITRTKQIATVFQVLARLREALPPFRYVLGGARLPEQFDVDREVARYELEDVVTITEYLDQTTFFEYIAAADLVINLRYPTGGETSGTLIRALGCGACVVVVDHGPFAELPDDICVKVPWSDRFGEDLEAALLACLRNPAGCRETGARAKRYLGQRHAIANSAAAYRRLLLDAKDGPERPWGVARPHRFLGLPERQALLAEAGAPPPGALWVREGLVPVAAGSRLVLASDRPDRQLPWLGRHGYPAELIDSLPWERPAPPGSRAAAAALLSAEEPEGEALQVWLRLLNRALAFGGVLVVDLLQAEKAGCGWLEEPARLEEALARAGFAVLRRALGGASDLMLAVEFPDGDGEEVRYEACWQAVKISEYPAPSPLLQLDGGAGFPWAA
ncbi:glycosyltransferase [Candidatus Methylocalor cossyra]|uniref:Glycosyltransferase involved in cell wall bisynthesis n=1 Tax=Candidatus Methylocalor cossyra TaxID=3108543 RepID=A0ABP1C8P7_9GAMM